MCTLHFQNCSQKSIINAESIKGAHQGWFTCPKYSGCSLPGSPCSTPNREHLFIVDHSNQNTITNIRNIHGAMDNHSFLFCCTKLHPPQCKCELRNLIDGQKSKEELLLWDEKYRNNTLRCIHNIHLPNTNDARQDKYINTNSILANTIGLVTHKYLFNFGQDGGLDSRLWCAQFWFSYFVFKLQLMNDSDNTRVGCTFWKKVWEKEFSEDLLNTLMSYKRKWIDGSWHSSLKDFATAEAGSYALCCAIEDLFANLKTELNDELFTRTGLERCIKELKSLLQQCGSFIDKCNSIIGKGHLSQYDIKGLMTPNIEWLGQFFVDYYRDYRKVIKPNFSQWALRFWLWSILGLIKFRQQGSFQQEEAHKTINYLLSIFIRKAQTKNEALKVLKRAYNEKPPLKAYENYLKDIIGNVWDTLVE